MMPTPRELAPDSTAHLARLRTAFDTRLQALETALADPSRGESLAGLILDLVRVAADEAQAAAAAAAQEARVAAEREIARALESSAAARGDAERAVAESAVLAREKADLQAAHDALVRAHAALNQTHDSLTGEISRQQETMADLYRLLADAQSQIELEQRAAAELRQGTERAEADRAVLAGRETDANGRAEDALARCGRLEEEVAALQTGMASAREETAAARREAASARQELDDARRRADAMTPDAAVAELRDALEQAKQKIASLVALQTETIAKTAAARRDLTAAQAEAAAAAREVGALRARVAELEAEHASIAGLREAVDRAEQQLASAVSVQVQATEDRRRFELELTLAQQEVVALRAELAASRKRRPAADRKKQADPALALAGEDEWAAVRLAARAVMREPVRIAVNSATGWLVDVSVDGCQLLMSSGAKSGEMVTLVLPGPSGALTCKGKIAWIRPEPARPGDPQCHRAGVAFIKPDETALVALIAAHGVRADS